MTEMTLTGLGPDGYSLHKDVVPRPLIDRLLSAICAAFRIDLDDPSSWYGHPVQLPLWGHQAQWDIRQNPGLHAIFAQTYSSERLWVSLDYPLFKPPVKRERPGEDGQALAIHWDVDPRDRYLLQGMVYLTDSPARRGAFRCVPELLRDHAGWLARHPSDDLSDIDLEGRVVISVPCQAGDLLIWDSRLPHGNGINHDTHPRITQAVTMQPPGFWGEKAEDRTILWETGRPNPHYRDQPGFDRVESWPPATLTPLGRKVLGADPWP